MKHIFFVLSFSSILATGCSSDENSENHQENMLSENIRQLENLSVYSLDQNPPLTVTLTQDQVFTETDEVFFGWAGNIAVDNEGRLFVQIGAEMGETGILVFNSDGSYKKTIGRHGGGPGEFEYIRDVTTSDEKLFVYENYEIHVFDLADLEFSHSIVIN
ncbi:MAG: 6-bladed beta-propeller, partial [Balneolaceae bacterium]